MTHCSSATEFGASLEKHFIVRGKHIDFDLGPDDRDAVFLPPRLRTDAEYIARDQKFRAAQNKERMFNFGHGGEEQRSPMSEAISSHSINTEVLSTQTDFLPGDVVLRKQFSFSATDWSTGYESSPTSQTSAATMRSAFKYSSKSSIASKCPEDFVHFAPRFWTLLEKFRSP